MCRYNFSAKTNGNISAMVTSIFICDEQTLRERFWSLRLTYNKTIKISTWLEFILFDYLKDSNNSNKIRNYGEMPPEKTPQFGMRLFLELAMADTKNFSR